MSRIGYIGHNMKKHSEFINIFLYLMTGILSCSLWVGCSSLRKDVKVPVHSAQSVKPDTASNSTTTNHALDTTSPGSITLKWRTESEQENYGFYLYRGLSKDGPWEKVNNTVIPGHGTTSEPHDYRFVDNGVRKNTTYYYQLEEVDFKGNASRKPYTIKGIDTKLGVMDKKDK